MVPISGVGTGAIQPLTNAEKVRGASKVQKSEEAQRRQLKPARDEYIPEEKREPSGRYWLGRDEDGQSRVYFDDPERAADAPQKRDEFPDADNPDKAREAEIPGKKAANDRKAETCTGNTDAVDREIEKLKKKQEELKRQIHSETDDTKIKELEKKLAQVESELRQKDNDTYRRQHTVFS